MYREEEERAGKKKTRRQQWEVVRRLKTCLNYDVLVHFLLRGKLGGDNLASS